MRRSTRHSRGSAAADATRLDGEPGSGAGEPDTNTTSLIARWSMDGARENIDESFRSTAETAEIAPADHARVCGTAFDVPIMVKSPDEEGWHALGGGESDTDDASDVAERLLVY